MSDAILVQNAGSSNIKLSVFAGHEKPSRRASFAKCHSSVHQMGMSA